MGEPRMDPDRLPLANARELATPAVPRWPRYVIGLGGVAYGILVIVAGVTASFALLESAVLVPVLAGISYSLGKRIADRDRDPEMLQFVLAAFSAKMMGTLVRAVVVASLYNGRSDALDYHRFGQSYAPQFRTLDFSAVHSWSGTDFLRALTGIVYSVTGASQVSGAIFMSFLSFVGSLLLWRAFRRAVPGGLHRRYALLVLFLPSLLYWPSAIGKEAWAILCLGVASYGVARVVTGSIAPGVALFFAGLGGVTLLRPHVALTMFSGVALAAAVGKSQRPGAKSGVLRLILFGSLVVVGVTLASSTASFFGAERLDLETGNKILSAAEGQTAEAGSAFSPVRMSNPLNTPLAIATVLFRPFPFEAGSAIALASSFEGVFLVVLTFRSRSRLKAIPRFMRRTPYVAYCFGTMMTFIFAFSSFSNFGILSRQRTQVLPFFLALICIPEWNREGTLSAEEALVARDEPVPDSPAAEPSDLRDPEVPMSGGPAAPDPYKAFEDDRDPYARFRDRGPRNSDDA